MVDGHEPSFEVASVTDDNNQLEALENFMREKPIMRKEWQVNKNDANKK